MFDSLQNKLLKTIQEIGGRGRLSEHDLTQVIADLRTTLLEADIHFQVAKNFCENLHAKLKGEKIHDTLTPDQTILKCARDELQNVLGQTPIEFTLKHPGTDISIIALVGLYGVGKTTQAVKLAYYLQHTRDIKPYLVSCDTTRPAAHEQLFHFATEHSLQVMAPPEMEKFDAIKRIKEAKKEARKNDCPVLIVDTAGRSSLDTDLLGEVKRLINKMGPEHVLLVLDASLGQSSLQVAKAFHGACPLTGNLITKCDSDTKGGVALSARLVTNRPIYFLGTGEHVKDLEAFDPQRMANRILDLGDLQTLFEKTDEIQTPENPEMLMEALKSGKFDLSHFKDQLKMMKGLGSLTGLMKFIPGMGKLMQNINTQQMETAEKSFKKFQAIIDSMTLQEREEPRILNGSRRKRIAQGSGTTAQDINTLLRQFENMKKMMKQMAW